jgi:hypothetical protein
MTANQKAELDSSYQSKVEKADANPHIRSVALDIRARYGAMRILGIGRNAQTLCHDFHHAGYTIASIETSENNTANPLRLAPVVHFYSQAIDSAPSPMKTASFDMAISIESSEPGFKPSTLVKIAANNLQLGGIFILSIPYSSDIKNLLIALCERWNLPFSSGWNDNYMQRWSKKCLTGLLKSQGFTVVELIGVRGSSLQWDALILVARKTGLPEPASDH